MALIKKKDELTIIVADNTEDMAVKAASDVARCILGLLQEKETINMIFAAAPSQSAFFNALVGHQEIPWNRINALHMDEYIGLEDNAPQRFGNFLERGLFGRVSFRSVFYIDGNNDVDSECRRYADIVGQFPPDIVCLGIGENGHLAFNDPHVALFNDQETVKPVSLDYICRKQQVDDKCFSRLEDVPLRAITLTIPTLLRGRYLFCIVPFERKADAVREALLGPVEERCPASILRSRPDTYLYLDKESASRIDFNKL